jgi:sulfatase maturation enzyme AslB (radical SAM superfamily)
MSRCSLLKNGVMISPDSKIEVCCQAVPHWDTPRPRWLTVDSWMSEYKESGKDFELYQQSEENWIDGCHGCRVSEERHGPDWGSRRIANLAIGDVCNTDNGIYYATINAGNICNLACKMCESGPSSKWGSIARHHPNKWIPERGLIEHSDEVKQYIDDHVLTDKLVQLSFGGGEPLMNSVYEEYLSIMINKGIAKNIKFQMITNGTRPLSDVWIEALRNFRQVEINFSLDGTGDNYDYIRTGAKFDDVIDNIKDIMKNISEKNRDIGVGFSYCGQALNAHKINQDIVFFNDFYQKEILPLINNSYDWTFGPEFITYPPYLSMSVLKPELMEKYGLQKEMLNFTYSESDYQEFMRFNGFWDKVNGTSLKDQNPDFFDESIYSNPEFHYKYGQM